MNTGRWNISSRLIYLLPGLLLFFLCATADAGFAKTHSHKKHTVTRIVIDPGHGGKDPGAIGPGGEKEKDITLAVAKILEERLEAKGFTVYLTREGDVFIPLEERTAFANRKKVDLFLSVHVNANENLASRGVETYFLNLTTDASSMKVAERENVMIKQSMSDLQFILRDLMLNARINESSRFASSIQHAVISSLGKSGCGGKNNGVKQAPFYVLMGAQMPSALIEMGFITNAAECRLLKRRSHQESIVNGIVRGINSFIANASYALNAKDK
jgi:N-acetylmuramoyl-L-alanine amidase